MEENRTQRLEVSEDALIRFVVEQGPQHRVLTLAFAVDGQVVEFELEDPKPLAAATELLEGILVGPLAVIDARADQIEGYPMKLSFSSDRGLFEVWARRIVTRRH